MSKLNISEVKYLQGKAGLKQDGIIGSKSIAAFRKLTGRYGGEDRKIPILYAQLLINKNRRTNKLKKDGIFGPITESALHILINGSARKKNRKKGKVKVPKRSSLNDFMPSRDTRDIIKHYGKPGENLVRMKFPCPMYYDGKLCKSTMVNRKIVNNVMYIFKEAYEHYGEEGMTKLGLNVYGGCYSNRNKRGGRTKSTHAFAIAFDLDPGNNRLSMGGDKATFAKEECQEWWNIVYKYGAISLGLEENYDYMHFQFTK